VHEHPGITIAQLAKRMKIKANYLYRVLAASCFGGIDRCVQDAAELVAAAG
jgi:hypothetical protein